MTIGCTGATTHPFRVREGQASCARRREDSVVFSRHGAADKVICNDGPTNIMESLVLLCGRTFSCYPQWAASGLLAKDASWRAPTENESTCLEAAHQCGMIASCSEEETPLMITPTILVGLLIGAVWLIIFLSGFCCLFSVPLLLTWGDDQCLAQRLKNCWQFS
eukprot:467430-Amphidinium_carterae.2